MEGLGCEKWRRIRSGKARSKVRMISPPPSGRADWTGPKAGDALTVKNLNFHNFLKLEKSAAAPSLQILYQMFG